MWADSYALSVCSIAERCGVFRRVGWVFCDGATVYQREGGDAGAVLLAATIPQPPHNYWYVRDSQPLRWLPRRRLLLHRQLQLCAFEDGYVGLRVERWVGLAKLQFWVSMEASIVTETNECIVIVLSHLQCG